jgi:prophage antirepressor-like protein
MQYELQIFHYEPDFQFRTMDINGENWFVLVDACRALDIKNPSDAARRLDDDEKGIAPADTLRGTQSMLIVNESGLFSLILRSDKPQAKKFKKWVTSEVPAIHSAHGFVHTRRRPRLYSPLQPKLGPDGRWVFLGAIGACNSHLGSLRANRLPNERKHRCRC